MVYLGDICMKNYQGEERKDFKMRELHDLNQQNTCPDHAGFGKELHELREDYYPFKEDLIKRNEACDLQIAQHDKDLEEQKSLRNHCKALALPKIRESIQENKDEICKIVNGFKTSIRSRIGETKEEFHAKLSETREEFIEQVNTMKGSIRYIYGTFTLVGILIGWLFLTGSTLHADQDTLVERQTKIELADSKIQTDMQYLKEDVSDIKDDVKEILKQLSTLTAHDSNRAN